MARYRSRTAIFCAPSASSSLRALADNNARAMVAALATFALAALLPLLSS